MSRLPLFLLALTTISVGCSKSQRITTTAPATPSTSMAEPGSSADVEAITMPMDGVPENASISLQRSGGAGATLYTVLIQADGRVQYHGVNLVDAEGRREGKMSPEVFGDLWLALAQTHNNDRQAYDACRRISSDASTAFKLEVFGGSASAYFFGETDAPCADNEAFTRVQTALARLQTEASVVEWVGEGNL